jgi:DNA-binding MarR family transcriptional regulator
MSARSSSPPPAVVAAFRRHVRVLEREVAHQLEADTGCCGVTLTQCHTLLELKASELSLTGLAAALNLDTSTLSRTVDGLARAGLVERTEDSSDRRALRLALTPTGHAKVNAINGFCSRYYAALLAGMGDRDRRCVLRAVELLGERMRTLRTTPACAASEDSDGHS